MELKEISEKELKEKLELHRKWLNDEEGGVKLDLRNTNLKGADLSLANLSYANLYEADLSKTEFYSTNLYKTKGNFVGVENIGSKNDTTHYFYNNNRIICGCFDGTMKEFEDKIKEIYKENDKEYKQYMIVIDTLKRLAELEGEE